MSYTNVASKLAINTELKRYYLHNFLRNAVKLKGGFFTMAYFYFHGFSAEAVVINIMVFAISALTAVQVTNFLINKIGVKKTFILHAIPTALSFFIVINVTPEHWWLFYLWMVSHGYKAMLWRIPLNAFFTYYGENGVRGKQLGIARILEAIANIIVPILFGALIDRTGIIIFFGIQTIMHIIAASVLGVKNDFKPKSKANLSTLIKKFPPNFKKAFFYMHLPYPFVADLFFIWVTIQFGSFVLAGVFIGLRVALQIVLSFLIGHLADQDRVRKIFLGSIILGAFFWFLIPFAGNAQEIFLLQFTIGISLLIAEIPFEREYHNAAKSLNRETGYSLAREIYTQLGMVIGCLFSLVLIYFIPEWKWLMVLGAVSIVPMAYLVPGSRKVNP